MGIILLLLVALSFIFWQTISVVNTQANYVNSSVTAESAIAQFAAQVASTHSLVTQYALSESDGDLRAAKLSVGQLKDEVKLVAEAYALADTNLESMVDKLEILTDRYRDSVTATIDAINDRRVSAAELVRSSTELSTTVAAIAETLPAILATRVRWTTPFG
jgi:methyl-accepting chemotaxis protein